MNCHRCDVEVSQATRGHCPECGLQILDTHDGVAIGIEVRPPPKGSPIPPSEAQIAETVARLRQRVTPEPAAETFLSQSQPREPGEDDA